MAAPDADGAGFDTMTSVGEIEARLEDLAARRRGWDGILGYCAYMVKRSGCGSSSGSGRSSMTARSGSSRLPARSCLLDDGRCLVRVARHFIHTWKAHVRKATTRSQKVRERALGRCKVPGCSRRAVHAHHIISRSRGGPDDPEKLVALCACHHLRGIHGGYVRVWGRAPDRLVWEVGGRIWKDGELGRAAAAAEARAA